MTGSCGRVAVRFPSCLDQDYVKVSARSLQGSESDGVIDRSHNRIDPASLSTLAERGAVPRLRKAVYWLHRATLSGRNASEVVGAALAKIGWQETLAGDLTAKALIRNLDIAGKLGCLDEAGLNDLRRGQAPTIKTGPYAGDELSVDHIIPFSVSPELDKVIANLEFLPLRLNQRKGNSITSRQLRLAQDLNAADLLSRESLNLINSGSQQKVR